MAKDAAGFQRGALNKPEEEQYIGGLFKEQSIINTPPQCNG